MDHNPLRACFDEFELDEAQARLRRSGQVVAVPPKAFSVLCFLARHPGALISKNALLDAVWGHQFVSDSALKTTISELRAALADDARHPRYIETVARRGYRFVAAGLVPSEADRAVVQIAAEPGAATDMPARAMVGRKAALARLQAAWESARGGVRQLFWVAGEAGVGKTTLIDHFAERFGNGICAYGQCVQQYGAGEPYLPVLEALGSLCRHDDSIVPLIRTVAPTWFLQMPWLIDAGEHEFLKRQLAGANQDRMLREWGELIDRLTINRPLLLVTEDLHWSDHATVHLMNHVARRRTPARFMWLATFRLTEIIAEEHPLKSLRNELRLHRLCSEVLLEPFTEQETAEFIASRHHELSPQVSFIRALHARTDGLPLFVAHVLDDLLAQPEFEHIRDEAVAEQHIAKLAVPENLAGIIARQSERLADDDKRLLEAASICGVEFRASSVAEALEREPEWVAAQCDALVREQQWLAPLAVEVLQDGGLEARYAFRHALYRHVFYERAGAMTHARLHRRVAGSLERLRARGAAVMAAELATHFELGHDTPSALRYAAEATESALRHFAPKEAMDLSSKALERVTAMPSGVIRDSIELTLAALSAAAAAQSLGVSSRAAKDGFERAFALLDRLQDHPQRALVLHGLGLVLMVRGEYPAAGALAQRTYEMAMRLSDPTLLLSACSVLGQIKTLQGHHQEARLWLERGVSACESLGDERLQAAFFVDPAVTMYAALSIPLANMGLVDQARVRSETATARARALGEPMAQMVAVWFASMLHIRLDDASTVESTGSEMRRIVEDAALAQGRFANEWIRGWALARRGAPEEGYQQIRAAYDENVTLGMLAGSSEVLGYAAEALLLAGRPDAAQEQLDQAFQRARDLDERVYLPQIHGLQARIAARMERPEELVSALLDGLHEAQRQDAPWLELGVALTAWDLMGSEAARLFDLHQICARLPEGLDTAPLRRARTLLAAGPTNQA